MPTISSDIETALLHQSSWLLVCSRHMRPSHASTGRSAATSWRPALTAASPDLSFNARYRTVLRSVSDTSRPGSKPHMQQDPVHPTMILDVPAPLANIGSSIIRSNRATNLSWSMYLRKIQAVRQGRIWLLVTLSTSREQLENRFESTSHTPRETWTCNHSLLVHAQTSSTVYRKRTMLVCKQQASVVSVSAHGLPRPTK